MISKKVINRITGPGNRFLKEKIIRSGLDGQYSVCLDPYEKISDDLIVGANQKSPKSRCCLVHPRRHVRTSSRKTKEEGNDSLASCATYVKFCISCAV